MTPLANPRWERLAQALATGMPASRAYADGGYRPHEGNASRMSGNEKVAARVAEIQSQAADAAALTVQCITERLLTVADKAEAEGGASGLSVARAVLMDVAKINGLVVDKSEVTATV